MILYVAKIWTLLIFFIFSSPYHYPIEAFLLFPFHVLVPHGCTHSLFWWLHCSRWLIPRILVLGGCVLTTISITLESIVVLRLVFVLLLQSTQSPLWTIPSLHLPLFGCRSLIEPSTSSCHWPLLTQNSLVHMSCILWLARVITRWECGIWR